MSYELTNTALKITVENNTYTLRRIKRVNLSKFKEKYDIILQKFMECNAAIGNFLMEQQNVNLLIDVCKLIPCDEDVEGFKFEYIEDDFALIGQLFLSESLSEEKLEFQELDVKGFRQSAIARFHLWNYEEALGKAQIAALEATMAIEEKLTEKKVALRKRRENLKMKQEELTT